MPPLLPRKTRWNALVLRSHRQRPSPTVHRVGVFALFTRLRLGSLALRPAVLHPGNSRPPVTRAPLPSTTKVYEQLLWRDLNPQVNQPVTAYGQFTQLRVSAVKVACIGTALGLHVGCRRRAAREATQPSVYFLNPLSDRRRSGQRLLCNKDRPVENASVGDRNQREAVVGNLWGGSGNGGLSGSPNRLVSCDVFATPSRSRSNRLRLLLAGSGRSPSRRLESPQVHRRPDLQRRSTSASCGAVHALLASVGDRNARLCVGQNYVKFHEADR